MAGPPKPCRAGHSSLSGDRNPLREAPLSDWPTEIRLSKDKRLLTVSFDDGQRHEMTAEMLRVLSPSAEVQGHSAAERKTVGGKAQAQLELELLLERIGHESAFEQAAAAHSGDEEVGDGLGFE